MVNLTRRLLWLIVPISLGLTAVVVLLAAMPARPAQAAAPQLAPAGCDNDLAETNNSYTEATALSVPGVLYRRYICDVPFEGDQDWYSITLAAGQHVAIFMRFRHADGDLDLYLFDTTGQILLASSNYTVSNEAISYTVPSAGVYYFEVDGYINAQNIYDLSISGGCYARATSEFASVDAQAVRDAVAQAAPGGTVKVAGYCPGTVTEFGEVQTARISKTLTLAGGYAPGNWTTPHPLTQPTTLDAMNSGRVLTATGGLTLTGLTVQKGSAPVGGGLQIHGQLVVSGATFYSNTAAFSGGGVFVAAGTQTILTDTDFIENVSESSQGGGMLALSAVIVGGLFQDNRAAADGGGLYVANLLNLDGTEFADNTAHTGGGAWTGTGAGSTVRNAFFSGNQAQSGAGVFAVGPLALGNSAFFGNLAQYGGGVYAIGPVDLSDSNFLSNGDGFVGGGIFANGPLTVNHSQFTNNSAYIGGGVAVYGTIQITRTSFINNSASSSGGGLYQSEPDLAAAAGHSPNGEVLGPGRLVNVAFANNSAARGTDLALVATVSNTLLHGTFWAQSQVITESIFVDHGSLTALNNLLTGYPTALKRNSGTVKEDYNLYFGGGATVASYLSGAVTSGGHSLVADPLLVDGPNSDFRLTYASPARDHGLNQGVPADFEDDPRPYGYGVDIGFDEIVGYPLKISLPAILR